jgi:tetratricopeptide (TPR) repeat protein
MKFVIDFEQNNNILVYIKGAINMKMNLKRKITVLAFGLLIWGQAQAIDFGDHTSSTITTKAWNALGAGQVDDTIAYVDKCIELYGAKAKEMNAGLSAYAEGKAASKLWALNDVGTCLFIKGQALSKKGDAAGAIAAYKKLVNEFKYAQTWDTAGWYWKPADAAKQKIVEMSMDL